MKLRAMSTLKLWAVLLGVLVLLGIGHVGLTRDVISADGETGLLITALHFDPAGESETEEAFRLMNVGGETLDLTGWSATNGRGTLSLAGTLDAGQAIWIASQAADFASSFGFAPDFEYAADSDSTPNLVLSGTLTLDNQSGHLIVYKADGILADAIAYRASEPVDALKEADGQARLSATDTLTIAGWVGPAITPYTRSGFVGEGQVLYRKLDPVSALPVTDTHSAADWAQAADDDLIGKRVMYPGWDLERYFTPFAITETATLTYTIAPDGAYEAIRAQIDQATQSLYFEGHTLTHVDLAEAIVERLNAHPGMTVTLLLDGAPAGGITDQQKWVCQQIEGAGGQVYYMAADPPARARYGALYGRTMIVDERVLLTGAGDLDPVTMPSDDKTDGTQGRRGMWMMAEAPGTVAHALDVFRHDLDPEHHRDLVRWSAEHPIYGAPPPGFEPERISGGTLYSAPYTIPFTVSGNLGLELIQTPENSLRASDGLLGLVARIGAGDRMWVLQSHEPPHWGPADSTPDLDPNPRLEAYLAAARRGAKIKLLLDRRPPNSQALAANKATCAYVSQVAAAEQLDIACRLGTPMGEGIGANAVLAWVDGKGYVHLGSIDGSEATAKDSRALAVQVQSDEAYTYLAWKVASDWNNATYSLYLPYVARASELPHYFAYAIQAHGEHKLPEIVDSAQDLGLTWIKQQVRWEQIEGTPGDYGWAGLDHIADTYNAAGFKVLFSVAAAPDWTRPGKPDDGPPDDYEQFYTFVGTMAEHFKGRVHAYEVWNEPNFKREWNGVRLNAADYVRLLQGAYDAIKAADPQAVVVSAAPTPTGINDGVWAIDDRVYLRQMYQAGLALTCDAIGVHPYGYANPPDVLYEGGDFDPTRGWDDHPSQFFRNTMEDYYAIMVEYGDGDKRLWATEFGWPTIDGMFVPPSPGQEYAADINEGQQADYTVRAFAWAREWGHAGVMFLWNLNYWSAVGPYSEMSKYSILRGNWTPRPVYEAYRDMDKTLE